MILLSDRDCTMYYKVCFIPYRGTRSSSPLSHCVCSLRIGRAISSNNVVVLTSAWKQPFFVVNSNVSSAQTLLLITFASLIDFAISPSEHRNTTMSQDTIIM